MKNFSDLTAIDTANCLSICLEIESHGNVEYKMQLNGNLITNSKTTIQIDLLAPIELTCQILDSNNGHTAVEIKNLSINNIQVLPIYLNCAIPSTNWLNQVGKWEFKIPNFYTWYHEITGQGWIA
jgi:hypothetical protein